MDPASFSVPGARPSPQATAPGVIDVTEATFQADVVERSRTTPVVLDLWASWCGPCRQLSPVLEKLAGEAGGAWVLAKVDVDANQRIAQALGVQGIPAVKAVVAGQIVGEFTGAMPEAEVRRWLAEVGVTGEPAAAAEPAPDPRLLEAQAAERRGDLEAAASAYRALLADQPGHPEATAGAARVDLLRRAATLDPEEAARAAAARPDDPEAVAALADVEVAQGRVDEAFARLLDLIRRSSGAERDRAREHLVRLFGALPEGDERVAKARRELASALY